MRFTLLYVFASFIFSGASAQLYKKIHNKTIVIDTHNDVMINILEGKDISKDLTGQTHSDIERFKKGRVDAQFFSIWSDETYTKGKGFNYANRQIDSLYATISRNADKLMLAKDAKELLRAVKQKKLAALIGIEGGHMIEDSLPYLETLFNRGARYLTLTWNNSTSWATSAADESSGKIPNAHKGLNELGKQVVRRMNELGMMVDLSHVGEQTFWDAIATTSKPVLVSHSCVYTLCPVPRNLKDEQIKAVAKNGGVIQLNFFSGFLDSNYQKRANSYKAKHKAEIDSLVQAKYVDIDRWFATKYPLEIMALRAPLSVLIDHIDYIVKLVGVNYVGLGSDFDGVSSTPQQLDDVSTFPLITKELLARGYNKKDIRKILGENFLRVFKANTKKGHPY